MNPFAPFLTLWPVLLLALLLVGLAGALRPGRRGGKKAGPLAVHRKARFLTGSEAAFYGLAVKALEGLPVAVFANVRLADVLQADRGEGHRASFNRVSQKHVDFLVVSLTDWRPLVAVELDGASHNAERQRARDAVKDEAFRVAGMPLVRVDVGRVPDVAGLRALLVPHVAGAPTEGPGRGAARRVGGAAV